MSEKKMVRRNVALALGIICIILVVGLLGTILGAILQISSLNSKVSDLTDIANLDKLTVVNDTTVTQTANNYTSWFFAPGYAGYVLVGVLSTTPNTYVRLLYNYNGTVNYDNQISVGVSGTADFPVLPSSPFSYYIFNDAQFSNTVFSTSFSNKAFPLSITEYAHTKYVTNIEIRVGNTNTVTNATETVEITYVY
jgi:uncharacterized membrane protein